MHFASSTIIMNLRCRDEYSIYMVLYHFIFSKEELRDDVSAYLAYCKHLDDSDNVAERLVKDLDVCTLYTVVFNCHFIYMKCSFSHVKMTITDFLGIFCHMYMKDFLHML